MSNYYHLKYLPGSVSWLAHNAQRWAIIKTTLPALFVITTSPTHTTLTTIDLILVQCIQRWPNNKHWSNFTHSGWLSARIMATSSDMLYPLQVSVDLLTFLIKTNRFILRFPSSSSQLLWISMVRSFTSKSHSYVFYWFKDCINWMKYMFYWFKICIKWMKKSTVTNVGCSMFRSFYDRKVLYYEISLRTIPANTVP